MKVRLRLTLCLSSLLTLSGCASTPTDATAALRRAPFILLGELHDNPAHHAARAALLTELLADRKRTTVVFEQLDRDQDEALKNVAPRASSQALIEAAGFDQKGWAWPLHKPVFDAALAGGATVRGGNISRDQARQIVRTGAAAWPADIAALSAATPWSDTQQAALVQDIAQSHCGALPASLLPGMAQAQRARDAALAQAMLNARAAAAERVVLIAGNGHVRRDRAVPAYLIAAGVAPGAIVSRGYLEDDISAEDAVTAYDGAVKTAGVARGDVCAGFGKQPGVPTRP